MSIRSSWEGQACGDSSWAGGLGGGDQPWKLAQILGEGLDAEGSKNMIHGARP